MAKRVVKKKIAQRTNKGPSPKFKLLRTLLQGAIRDGVPKTTIAKRANVSYATIHNWARKDCQQQSCSLDKAHAVLRAIDAEMGLGD